MYLITLCTCVQFWFYDVITFFCYVTASRVGNNFWYNRKICSKMITSIIRYHTAIYYIMSITRDRFRRYWVSSGGCKKHSIINMLKKTNFPLSAKKEKCNTKQYDTAIPISWGSQSSTHTHDMDYKSHR